MSYSDEDSDRETLSVGLQEGDQRLKQYWAKKARRRSSLFKKFDGDKLALKDNAKIGMLMTKYLERSVLFSGSVIKVNRRGRTQERWLMITDGALYNIDPSSVKVRRRIPLGNISHISTSLMSDNFFIIHVPVEYDYLFVSRRKTEIVSILRLAHLEATGEELSLAMQNTIDYRIDKDQQRRLVFQRGENGVYTMIYAKVKKTR